MNNAITLRITTLRFSSPLNLSLQFPFIPQKVPNHLNPFTRKRSRAPKILAFCAATSSESLSCGGWDTPQLAGDSVGSGESNHLHSLLNSLGINDRKYVFVYVLGFVCALAISRVKVSSFIALPACMMVFVLGFTTGLVNGGKMSSSGTKKMPEDDVIGVPFEKLNFLVESINGFGAKILDLKNDVKKGIECNHITVGDLENFVNSLESANSSAVNAKSIIDDLEMGRSSNQKPSRQKKDPGENQYSFTQFFAGLFQEKPDIKHNRLKSFKDDNNDLMDGNILGASSTKDRNINNILTQKDGSFDRSSNRTSFSHVKASRSNTFADENAYSPEMDYTVQSVIGRQQQYGYRTNRTHYMRNEKISLKNNGYLNGSGIWTSGGFLNNSMEFTETVSSFQKGQEVNELEQNYSMFDGPKRDDKEEDCSSDDMSFDKCISEANILLKEAKGCSKKKGNDKIAEDAFRKSAVILSKATHIRPMSLLAAGLLGNTYLLHGELKLRTSRDLRMLLTRTNVQNEEVGRKEEIVSNLFNVCEECEELLVNAGRQYKLALSIDGNDMRALYNWGLALSFRAQLISDIGPGAVRDADKVFLAAIDKFDAMMSKSNEYAPDALFRWGAALQERSRLRPRRSREKVRLLQQARRLYEDALGMDSGNLHLQKALSSCISELNWFN
ncbi:unnamed protein product [Cuscuta campestris]|uniref:Uncharacterized protein n=1 Tax=Cuscuta campestris TaxID=132261 RepID=A0A484MN72_9ASTE|nr:unnamed protein product [Cuscuta campestris]